MSKSIPKLEYPVEISATLQVAVRVLGYGEGAIYRSSLAPQSIVTHEERVI